MQIQSELSSPCQSCDGDGVVGSGGPGNYRCPECAGVGKVPVTSLPIQEVLKALNSMSGYSPSGNRVIQDIAKKLGLLAKGAS